MTEYDTHLRRIAGRVGGKDEYFRIKTKELGAIADTYDWLVDECQWQQKRMWEEAMERA